MAGAWYLRSVSSHADVRFGWPVPVPEGQEDSFPYQMTSAYAPGAEFSFSLRGASGPCHMLDQVWFDATRFRCYVARPLVFLL